ncbi:MULTISPECIES: hypothetical protein [Trichocoleus]|uniref:Uncharacterized protein n=1 Tax=Trichocoleus desertorum GB2-A4 TaxID=2933944 RepID=A0ABV0J1D0_9CYAN|nr:hypothetical protein [Trichocoleus sp. FACHB-46]MBD1860209.1 hypothetical protein [Trichocoleus sp. FACHB-46]
MLEAELPRTLKLLGVEANADQQAQAIAVFSTKTTTRCPGGLPETNSGGLAAICFNL